MTSFRKELDEILRPPKFIKGYRYDFGCQVCGYDPKKAKDAIIALVDGLIPEKIIDSPQDPFWQDEMSSNAKMTGFNLAVDTIRKKLHGGKS